MDRDLIEAECSRHVPPVNPPHQQRRGEDNSLGPGVDSVFSSRMSGTRVNRGGSAESVELCRLSKPTTAPSAGNSNGSKHAACSNQALIPNKHPDFPRLLRLLPSVVAALMSRERLPGGGAPSVQLLSDFMSLKRVWKLSQF